MGKHNSLQISPFRTSSSGALCSDMPRTRCHSYYGARAGEAPCVASIQIKKIPARRRPLICRQSHSGHRDCSVLSAVCKVPLWLLRLENCNCSAIKLLGVVMLLDTSPCLGPVLTKLQREPFCNPKWPRGLLGSATACLDHPMSLQGCHVSLHGMNR